MRGLPTRKLLLLGGGVAAILLVVGLPSAAQDVLDPIGEASDAECYSHHKAEGFRSMDLFAEKISQVEKGKPFEFQLTIKNPWLHDVTKVSAYVNISNAPGLAFAGAKPPEETSLPDQTAPASPQQYARQEFPIEVTEGATEIYASLVGTPTTTTSPLPTQPGILVNNSDYHLDVLAPDGEPVSTHPPFPPGTPYDVQEQKQHRLAAEARVNTSTLLVKGPGTYKAVVYYGGLQDNAFSLFHGAYYNASSELLLKGPDLLKPNEQFTFKFTVNAKDAEALQRMRYGGRAIAFHQHTDGNIESEGTYDKWNTLEFEVGAQLVKESGGLDAAGSSVSLLEPVLRRWGQVLGFASAFLIIPSLVFGGTFGKGSVSALNQWFGGPRRRVLFHNSMSFWLLGVSLLHLFIFLYEAFWVWSAGLVWGGLTLAAMIGLGITGATQRRFVARWGFNRWRYVHFAMGVLVVVFSLVHMVADGSHFAGVRAWFGPDVPK